MVKLFLATLITVAAIAAPVSAGPAATAPGSHTYQKIKAADTVLKKKNGYWTECTYTAVGENCYTVYAGSSVKPAAGAASALRPVKASAGKLGRKNGYIVQCDYSGLGDNCYYVYARARGLHKSK